MTMINDDGCFELNGQRYLLVTLDYETAYGRGYSLRQSSMNTYKYICDDRYKEHGVGIKIGRDATVWYDEWSRDEIVDVLAGLQDRPEKIALLCHNTHFDGLILHLKYDGWHPDLYLDTQSMSQGMFVGHSASLGELAKRLWPNDPTMRKGDELTSVEGILDELTPEQSKTIGRYCIQDCDLTFAAFERMWPYYPDAELALIHMTIRFNCWPFLEVDEALLDEEIAAQKVAEFNLMRDAFNKYGVLKDQLSSNPQFVKVVESLNIPVPMKLNAKGQEIPAMGQQDWDYQKMVAAHPEHKVLWDARKNAKSNIQLSRAQWVKAVGRWCGGQLPVPIKYYGAATGRYSGQEKLNLQNLPRIAGPGTGRLRRAMVAPKGFVVVVRDLANIEGRMLAWLAGQHDKLDRFRRNECTYLHLASKIYGIPFETMSKQTHGGERNVGKVGDLGLGYGLGVDGFWRALNTGPMGMAPIICERDFAENIVLAFRELNDRIVAYWRTAQGFIESMYTGNRLTHGPLEIRQNHIVMPNGMALQYPNLTAFENRYGSEFKFGARGAHGRLYGAHLVENITQALARVLIGEQMVEVDKRLDENYGHDIARLVHMVHDEMIAVVPEADAEDTYNMMGEVMATPPDWCLDLPLKSEGGWAIEYSK